MTNREIAEQIVADWPSDSAEFSGDDWRSLRAAITAALDEKDAEIKAACVSFEREREYDDESLRKQGLRRINHESKQMDPDGMAVDVVDFWVAPPPGHILDDGGVVREICSEDTNENGYTSLVLYPAEAARAKA